MQKKNNNDRKKTKNNCNKMKIMKKFQIIMNILNN